MFLSFQEAKPKPGQPMRFAASYIECMGAPECQQSRISFSHLVSKAKLAKRLPSQRNGSCRRASGGSRWTGHHTVLYCTVCALSTRSLRSGRRCVDGKLPILSLGDKVDPWIWGFAIHCNHDKRPQLVVLHRCQEQCRDSGVVLYAIRVRGIIKL